MPLPSKLRPRKPARSQEIESLLQRKDKWNKNVSELIHELIALKRLFNGAGDPEYGLKPRRIVDHFDGSESSFLNEVSQLFSQVSSEGRDIVQMQNENSQKRKQRILERAKNKPAPVEPAAAPPAPTTAASKLELISQGTNPLTRALLNLKAPFKKDKGFRALKDIHSFLFEMKNEVEEMQDAVVSKNSLERLKKAFETYKSLFHNANAMYNKYLNDTGNTDSAASMHESDLASQFEFYKKEFLMADSIDGTSHKWKTRFIALGRLFESVKSEYDKINILDKIKGLHEELLGYYKDNYQLRTPGPWTTISEFIDRDPVFSSSTQESTENNKQRKRELAEVLQPYAQEFQIAASIPGTPSSYKTRFLSLVKAYESASDVELQDRLEKILILYKELIAFYKNNYTFSGPWTSVAELYHKNPKFITPEDYAEGLMAKDQMVTLAHNVLSRLLKKLMELSISGDTHKGVKLELFEELTKTRENIFKTMDLIEGDDKNSLELGLKIKELKRSFDETRRLIELLSPGKSK